LPRLDAQSNLAAATDEDDIRFAPGRVDHDVSPFCQATRRRKLGAIVNRQRLTATDDFAGMVLDRESYAIRLGHLIRVSWSNHQHARHSSQRDELLDRLMRRTVLAEADGVVSPDV